MKTFILIAILLIVSLPVFAQEYEDGTYDATVTTESGTYSVPVEVEDGEVTGVHWPNGGNMNVIGADIDDNTASGSSYDGRSVEIEIEE